MATQTHLSPLDELNAYLEQQKIRVWHDDTEETLEYQAYVITIKDDTLTLRNSNHSNCYMDNRTVSLYNIDGDECARVELQQGQGMINVRRGTYTLRVNI